MSLDPTRYIEIKTASGAPNVYKVLSAVLGAIVANNQTVITGVASQIIRVLGFHNYGGAGVSDYTLKEETSLTTKWLGILHTAQDIGEFYESGYYELATGKGLIADVRTTGMYFNIQYVVYTA